jgi:hypothetical protein
VVEHHAPGDQVPRGKLLLDRLQALEQPIHGRIQVVVVRIAEPRSRQGDCVNPRERAKAERKVTMRVRNLAGANDAPRSQAHIQDETHGRTDEIELETLDRAEQVGRATGCRVCSA